MSGKSCVVVSLPRRKTRDAESGRGVVETEAVQAEAGKEVQYWRTLSREEAFSPRQVERASRSRRRGTRAKTETSRCSRAQKTASAEWAACSPSDTPNPPSKSRARSGI